VLASLALGTNLILIIGLMSLPEAAATLTLPGIAGLVLTVGMAIDANVIIFERIREELRSGKLPRAAVDTGFQKARWTILDANITTLITAIVLYEFGTGPIKGFAVTLSIGILTSVFSALVITRLLFDLVLRGDRRLDALSI
jgi:preprotein translocase subunit SecD